jgi:Flp pilus assembly protein TadD
VRSKSHPGLIPAQVGLIQLELSGGHPDAAMVVARKIQSERPKESVGYVLAGDIEASRVNWVAASAAYRAGLERGKSTELAGKLYDALVSGAQPANAERVASEWLKEHPRTPISAVISVDVAVARQDFEAAKGHYLAVVQLQPENPIGLNNLAWVMNRLKEPGAITYARGGLRWPRAAGLPRHACRHHGGTRATLTRQ